MDDKGFYYKATDEMLDKVDNVEQNYAYDTKAQNLYVLTDNSNCIVTLNKDYAKIIKKNKTIPHMKGNAIDVEIAEANKSLDDKFENLNALRRQHIADSIAQARKDSIIRAKEDSIKFVQREKKKEEYRNAHKWRWIPIGYSTRLTCSDCDKTISYQDSILCAAVKNDTIYGIERKDLALGYTYLKFHKFPIPSSLKSAEKFCFHNEVFADSLTLDKMGVAENIEYINALTYLDAVEDLKKYAPYGYFENWEWNNEYSIEFNFTYTNTNSKTIKYIDVYFVVTNDVGDVRKTGSFKGTGPLEEGETASWSWDHSQYYTAGDASKMNISKVIITYMNGTQKVLTKNMLRFN